MKRINAITKTAAQPATAQTILTKSAQITNLRAATATVQEIFDILLKVDTFGN